MATGEQIDTITQGIRIDNPPFNLEDLLKQIRLMSAEERESTVKKLEVLIKRVRSH